MIRRLQKILIVMLVAGCLSLAEGFYYHLKAAVAQQLLENAWQKSQLNLHNNIKPWPWADTWPVFKLKLLKSKKNDPILMQKNIKQNIEPLQLVASNIVLADASGESLAFAPGLMTSNIYPGDLGNSFIAAHRDTHFESLADIDIDDQMWVEFKDGTQLVFIVDQREIVNSELQEPILNINQSRLTLVTCYPFDVMVNQTPLRLLISGYLSKRW